MTALGDEPTSAAAQVVWRFGALLQDGQAQSAASLLADDFVYRDRRKLVGSPEIDKAAYLTALALLEEMGVQSADRSHLATRGDRLLLSRLMLRYRDGSEREYLALVEFNAALNVQGLMHFDVDDLDVAMAELDRLAAELDG